MDATYVMFVQEVLRRYLHHHPLLQRLSQESLEQDLLVTMQMPPLPILKLSALKGLVSWRLALFKSPRGSDSLQMINRVDQIDLLADSIFQMHRRRYLPPAGGLSALSSQPLSATFRIDLFFSTLAQQDMPAQVVSCLTSKQAAPRKQCKLRAIFRGMQHAVPAELNQDFGTWRLTLWTKIALPAPQAIQATLSAWMGQQTVAAIQTPLQSMMQATNDQEMHYARNVVDMRTFEAMQKMLQFEV